MSRQLLSFSDRVRSIAGIIVFFIVFLTATPLILFLLILSLGELTNFIMEYIAPIMMKPVFAVSGIRFSIRQHGDQVTTPAIYIINHSSTIDLLTILALGLPRIRFVAKWELQYNPIFFLLGRLTGQVFIKRQDSERAIYTLQHAYERIRKQKLSLLLAPEGSRKHPGIIGPFKKGPFRVAMALGYPVVPIYFEGSHQLSIGGSLLTQSGEVTAHIHSPIDISGWRLDYIDDHISSIRRQYMHWAKVIDEPDADNTG